VIILSCRLTRHDGDVADFQAIGWHHQQGRIKCHQCPVAGRSHIVPVNSARPCVTCPQKPARFPFLALSVSCPALLEDMKARTKNQREQSIGFFRSARINSATAVA
jgi:hypothetical protein